MTKWMGLLSVMSLALVGAGPLTPPTSKLSTCTATCGVQLTECFRGCLGNPACKEACEITYDNCIAACGGSSAVKLSC